MFFDCKMTNVVRHDNNTGTMIAVMIHQDYNQAQKYFFFYVNKQTL